MKRRSRPGSARRPVNLVAATVAGLAAGLAFVLTMEIDLRLTGRNVDDRIALGRPLVAGRAERAKTVGLALHLVNSVGFAWLYAWLQRWIPGPPWWRGVAMFNIENLLLYPLTAWEDLH